MESKNRKHTGKRPAPVSYRPPEKLRDEFYARAKNSGLSLNAYITQAVFERGSGSAACDKKMLALLLSQAARINTHLEEMEACTSGGHVMLLEECRHELAEIRAALLEGMRKRT